MDAATAKEVGENPSPTPPAVDKETGETATPNSASETAIEIEGHVAPPAKDGHDLSEGTSATGIDLEKQPKQEAEVPPRDITGWRWITVVLAILSSTLLFALDNTIVADIQPVIVEHFDSVSKLTWLIVEYLIGAAATNLVWGKVFGQFNAKWTYIFCVLLFEVGSAICGAAPTMDALIIGRAICGVGGSGAYMGVMTLLAATTTIHERPMYVGGTGLTWRSWVRSSVEHSQIRLLDGVGRSTSISVSVLSAPRSISSCFLTSIPALELSFSIALGMLTTLG